MEVPFLTDLRAVRAAKQASSDLSSSLISFQRSSFIIRSRSDADKSSDDTMPYTSENHLRVGPFSDLLLLKRSRFILACPRILQAQLPTATDTLQVSRLLIPAPTTRCGSVPLEGDGHEARSFGGVETQPIGKARKNSTEPISARFARTETESRSEPRTGLRRSLRRSDGGGKAL